ncbi:MAG: AAA family ATPase [Actinobacteria bacterium]|nr:AAA family ATPase [Actinomycetota bacterium]
MNVIVNPSEVIVSLRAQVAASPHDAVVRCQLGQMLNAIGQRAEALGQLSVAIAFVNDPVQADAVAMALREIADSVSAIQDSPISTIGTPGSESDEPDGNPPQDPAVERGIVEFGDANVTLADVAGLAQLKQLIDIRLLRPMREPDLAKTYGRTARGGLLMWGPPGCGKTYFARALAGTMGLSFGSISAADIFNMWVGGSEGNLAAVFNSARVAAPCVLFIDETDAIGRRRSATSVHLINRNVVSQLLVELDGARSSNDGVFVLGATNAPWDIDPALRRPGRFDRTVFVPPPDLEARAGILAGALASVPIGQLDVVKIAKRLSGISGADVAFVARTAIDAAYEEASSGGRTVDVQMRHLEDAADRSHPSIDEWLAIAQIAADSSDDAEMFGPFISWQKLARRER